MTQPGEIARAVTAGSLVVGMVAAGWLVHLMGEVGLFDPPSASVVVQTRVCGIVLAVAGFVGTVVSGRVTALVNTMAGLSVLVFGVDVFTLVGLALVVVLVDLVLLVLVLARRRPPG